MNRKFDTHDCSWNPPFPEQNVSKKFSWGRSVPSIVGTVSIENQRLWFAKTQWKYGGEGTVSEDEEGNSQVLNTAGKLVDAIPRKNTLTVGMTVKVYRRNSPLRYNGYYSEEVVWLAVGEALPEEYPPVEAEMGVVEEIFGTQKDQSLVTA